MLTNNLDTFLQTQIDQKKRNFILLGETGSGKSEIALNIALELARFGQNVHFFDMDQTKPIFRSRELSAYLKENHVTVDAIPQLLDSPTVPPGIATSLADQETCTVLDIGGNVVGARTIGQYVESWGQDTVAFMVVNVFRPGSSPLSSLQDALSAIAGAARIPCETVACNPNFGADTTVDDVMAGWKHLRELLDTSRFKIRWIVAEHSIAQKVRECLPGHDVFGIRRYIRMPWEITSYPIK